MSETLYMLIFVFEPDFFDVGCLCVFVSVCICVYGTMYSLERIQGYNR